MCIRDSYLVTADACETTRRSWTCTPAALASLPDRAFTDLRRRFRGLELLFDVPPAVGAAPDLVSDQRPPPVGEVAEWDEAFAVAAGSE
eukprot:11922130-Alexandrium_andersonii.AAC.1